MDASNGARIANLLIDSVFRLIVAGVVGVVCGVVGIDVKPIGVSFLFGLVTIVAYYLSLEGLFGFTLGKLITGTRLVALDTSEPKFSAIVGRTFARFIPLEPFSFLGSDAGWHDRMSGTRVVRVRKGRAVHATFALTHSRYPFVYNAATCSCVFHFIRHGARLVSS